MGYVWEEPRDRQLHRAYHDEWQHGVKMSPLRSDEIIATDGGTEFLLISPSSHEAQKRRAARVATNANRETRFDFGLYDGGSEDRQMRAHVIIARRDFRGIGLGIARRRDDLWHYSWEDYDAKREVAHVRGERWSIDYLWVRRDVRGTGLAQQLVTHICIVLATTAEDMAWLAPLTPSAERLVRRLSPREVWLS
jgi:GNAT superfamily N-acetyltransferase